MIVMLWFVFPLQASGFVVHECCMYGRSGRHCRGKGVGFSLCMNPCTKVSVHK